MSNVTVKETKALFEKETVQKSLKDMLGKRSSGFVTSVLAAMNNNDKLKTADPNTVYMAAMTAASLDLPINQNLGLAYIIPYNIKQSDGTWKVAAQFQIGYKGFIQLALRSGEFKTISATPVYEGQLKSQDPLMGFEFDWTAKKSETIIGYASYFQLLNGFEKTLYMEVEELKTHGSKYSKTFKQKGGLWNNDFEAMARKTVIKLLLSRYAPLSIEMQKAAMVDQGIVNDWESGDSSYDDNPIQDIPHEELSQEQILENRFKKMIDAADTIEKLEQIADNTPEGIPESLDQYYADKHQSLVDGSAS